MTIPEVIALVEHLEKSPGPESVYRPVLEQAISELMDAIFEATDAMEKSRLATLELRARGIREQWKVRDVN